jgi:hypothetical protein
MPPRKRVRVDTETVYAHGNPLRQKKFPPRRNRAPARIPSPSQPPMRRQHTMTQAGYILAAPPSETKKRMVEQVEDSQSEPESGSEIEGDEYQSILRQTTLTQLGHGVQDLPTEEEGLNRRASIRRRRQRGMTEEEKRQQTLTQMFVPGMGQEIGVHSEGEEVQEDVDADYAAAISQRLVENGLYTPLEAGRSRRPARNTTSMDGSDSNGRSLRPRRGRKDKLNGVKQEWSTPKRVRVKADPLSTTRRRRPLEIPSSQTPHESPEVTAPWRGTRSPLKERSTNTRATSGPQPTTEGSAKGFTHPVDPQSKETARPSPAASARRIIQDTIPDSEDEDEEESDAENIETGHTVIGEETQAMIQEIDLKCASAQTVNETKDEGIARLDQISHTPHPQETEELPIPSSQEEFHRSIKQEHLQIEESQRTTATGTEEATAQLHSELETYTQRISIHPSSSRLSVHQEQPEQRFPSSYPVPTQGSHPSQASTIEGSQFSPHDVQHSHHTLPISPTRPPPLIIPSSIPTSPFRRFREPSSQTQHSRQSTGVGRTSLIIPDSLDEYSIPPPPRWSGDD